MIVPAVSDESEHAAPRGREAAARWWTGGAAGRAACRPWMRRWMRRSRRSVTSRCTTNCTRSPACHLPGRRASGPFALLRGPLRNGMEAPGGVDEHGAEGGLPGAAEGWRSRYRRPRDRRVKSDHGGTAGRPSAESRSVIGPRVPWRDESARRFTLERSTPRHAACSGTEGRHWRWSGSSGTNAPRPLVGGHRLREISRARDTMRSTRSHSPPSRRRR